MYLHGNHYMPVHIIISLSLCIIRYGNYIHIRSACKQHGLWDQIRVDHGKEFYLVLFIKEMLRKDYGPREVLPYTLT